VIVSHYKLTHRAHVRNANEDLWTTLPTAPQETGRCTALARGGPWVSLAW